MLEIILKGLIIGLFLSVPLGPIGMLCIQRTLNRGRKHGIATGIGATTSDIVYSVITLFSLSFVLDVIEQNKLIIQICGSVIMIIFGLYIFRSHPATQPKPNEKAQHTLFGDFISSFGLTLSNPLVLFVLIALFARFNFIDIKTTLYHTLCGILAILGGALLWWLTLTFLASHFRHMFNRHGLRVLNQITGSVIMLIGLVGLISGFFE
jgi:threonine/homoserine/homoserine lactone efflux protein